MATPLYRAWRFLHPDFDVPAAEAGLRVSRGGGIEMVEAEASVRQAILLLLSTRPGERVMRPAYGCDLHKLVFMPNDETTAGLAIHYVRRALERWELRVDLLHLDAGRCAADPGRLEIVLEYRVRRTLQSDRLVFPLSLMDSEE